MSARRARPAFALAFALGALLAAPPLAPATPRAVLAESSHDYGMLGPREAAEYRFTIKNAGDQPLVLAAPRTFDEGALARAERDTVAPGAETGIVIAVRPVEPGPFHTKVVLASNDPDQPQLAFILAASVAPWVAWDRANASVGAVRAGTKDVVVKAFELRQGSDLTAAGAVSSLPFVIAEVRGTADSLVRRLAVSIGPDAPAGPFSATIGLVAVRGGAGGAAAWRDTIRTSVEGVVYRRWLVTPNPFDAVLTSYSWREGPRILCRRAEGEGRVLGATTTVPGHEVRLETVKEGRAYAIRLMPTAGWKAGTWNGEVRITTDDPAERSITVPVRVLVGPARAAG